MRWSLLLGVALILAGGVVVAKGLNYNSKHDVIDLGQLRVSVDEKKPVPPWIGGVAALAGLVLVFAGGSRKA